MPRFGKDKNARNEELDRQAAEEVERLTRRGAAPGMGGGMPGMPGMGGGGPRIGPPSPLEMMAAEVADRPPPSRRRAEPARRPAARPQQAFTAMPSGGVGSSFGPGGLNPGPRGAAAAPPPPAFGGGAYDDDYGGHVTGPPVYNAGEYDEDEEMSITEMALMDHAARTGFDPEDLVMTYDASSAEEMRDAAMRQFYERQQARRPGAGTNDPFAPAGQRRGPSGPAPMRRAEDPKAAGGALAQRLAARRREEEARRATPVDEPAGPSRPTRATAPSAATAQPAERQVDDGALSRVLARRRAALGVDTPAAEPAPAGPRHSAARPQPAPTLRAVPELDDDAPTLEDMAASTAPKPAKKPPAKRAAKKAAAAEPIAMPPADESPAADPPAKRGARKAPAAATEAPAKKAPAKRATEKAAAAETPAAKAGAKKAGATLAKAPAKKGTAPAAKKAPAKKAAARPAGKAKTVFCIECGEKNPAIAKFCFNCGTRLAAPEG